MPWVEPIIDRTLTDALYAAEQIKRWISGEDTTAPTDLKGCLNYSDLNRIEENTRYLADLLNSLAYYNDVETKEWAINGEPNIDDIARVINNVKSLISAYSESVQQAEFPTSLLTYQAINAIEINLKSIKDNIDIMAKSFRKSGTFKSGINAVHLPLQRSVT